jgi:hypothetical protein
MTEEDKQKLFEMRAEARRLLDQVDALWEAATKITGEPVDHYFDALCTHDFIWNGSSDVEADFELMQRTMVRKYGQQTE